MEDLDTMAKRVLFAQIRVPDYPRVRFFKRAPEEPKGFRDVTGLVAKLIVEEVPESEGRYALLRLDAKDELVWRTTYPSLQEMKWHAEFEYGLPEEKWQVWPESNMVTSA